MKRKLTYFIGGTLFFNILVVTLIFISMVNYQYEQNIKYNLKGMATAINSILISNDNIKSQKLIDDILKNTNTGVVVLNSKGKAVFQSTDGLNTDNNTMNSFEVEQALKSGESYTIKYDIYADSNVMYYVNYNHTYIIETFEKLDMARDVLLKYINYYLLIISISAVITIWFSFRLSKFIMKPIKELEFATSLLSRGELQRRVRIETNDELGHLGKNFNYMAEQLQIAIKDSLIKQSRLEAILKSMDSGVIAVDRSNRIILINPYAEKLFGIDDSIIGEKLIDTIRDFELENIFQNDEKEFSELRILWPSEKILRVRTATIVNDENKNIGKVAVVQDVTDIKKLENMRSSFVANVSHELKTPLTSIKGFAETLRFVKDDKKRNEFLNIIDEEAERLTRLINDILTLSDIEATKEQKVEEFNVNQVLENVYKLMKNTADIKGISLSISSNDYVNLKGDVDKFKQMLINLVDNGIKYSENGDSVTVGVENNCDYCTLWVEDTGVGIPKHHIPRLFERFYRVDKARSRAKGGTGLGLAIVKHIVMGMDGTINIESEEGVGSKFILTFPVKN